MATPASIKKHPVHPMLVVFPIGLWVFSLASDIIYRTGWGTAIWNEIAFYTMLGGIAGALLAAIPGLIDLFSLSGRPKNLGIWHMTINLVVVLIFVVNASLRNVGTGGAGDVPFALSIAGVVLMFISGWLGAEMVHVHGVSVDTVGSTRWDDREAPRRVA
jgi:uncharacterized membrane protein